MLIENSGVLFIAMAVAFVSAAMIVGRGLFNLQIFPKFSIKEYGFGIVAGTLVIWAVLNVSWLGVLAGLGLVLFVLVPRILKLEPIKIRLPKL